MKNKILTLLLSVVVAFGLWMYVVTVEHTQIELTFYNIPVNWNGEEAMNERDLRLVDRNMTVNMKLYGNRSVLNKMKNSDIIVLADLTHITGAGEKKLNYDVSFTGFQTEHIEIVDKPASIDVQVAQWMDKTVLVEVVVDKDAKLGSVNYTQNGKDYVINFVVDRENMTSSLKTVDISGPIEVIEQIVKAQVKVDMTDSITTYDGTKMVTLCDQDGNGVDAKNVYVSDGGSTNVVVPVLAERQVGVSLNVQFDASVGNLLTSDDVKVTGLPGSISIRGSLEAVKDYPDSHVMDYKITDINQKLRVETFAIELPNGLQSDTFEVVAKIELPELVRETFTVSKDRIQWSAVPLGYAWEMPEDVQVTICHKVMDAVTAENITLTIRYGGQPAADGKYDYTIVLKNAEGDIQFRNETTEKKIAVSLWVPAPELPEDTANDTEAVMTDLNNQVEEVA